ncbi:MAG: hypothetical protein ACT4P6_14065 [Gemmatimonadaceae bacterium]
MALIERSSDIRALLERTKRIAVLGIKTDEYYPPAYYVPEYAKRAGYEIVPVAGLFSRSQRDTRRQSVLTGRNGLGH